jgi:hypothetical protein
LDENHSIPAIAERLKLKLNTIDKAIRGGHLHKPLKKKSAPMMAHPEQPVTYILQALAARYVV